MSEASISVLEAVVMWKARPSTFMTVSSIVLAFAPKCPVCFLAYFGVFGVAASSASAYRVWLPPITALWLALTVALLAVGRGTQGRIGPVSLALVSGIAVFAGRFNLENRLVMFAGLIGLAGATLWRASSRGRSSSCDQCEASSTNKRAWRTRGLGKFIGT